MLDRTLGRKFLRFLTVGAPATLIQYAVLVVLVELCSLKPAPASSFGFAVSAVANYLLNRRFTFGSSRPHRDAAARFLAVVLLGLLLNYAAMSLLTALGANYVLAQLIATGAVLILNFALGSLWVFK